MAGQVISKIKSGDGNTHLIAPSAYLICNSANNANPKIFTFQDSSVTSFTPIDGTTIIVDFINGIKASATTVSIIIQTSDGNNLLTNTFLFSSRTSNGVAVLHDFAPGVHTLVYYNKSGFVEGETPSSTVTAISTTSAAGTSDTFARGDHVHNITVDTITAALGYVPANASSSGAALGTGTPSVITTTTGVAGNSSFAAPFNHTHQLTKETVTSALGYTPPTENTDTKVTTSQRENTEKIYLCGTKTASTSTLKYDTDVYISNTAADHGTLVATTFKGDLDGTATNASVASVAFALNDGPYVVYDTQQPNNSNTLIGINPN